MPQFIPVRRLTEEEFKGSGQFQKFYCETCKEETGNGLRYTETPHCTECGQHHAANQECDEV